MRNLPNKEQKASKKLQIDTDSITIQEVLALVRPEIKKPVNKRGEMAIVCPQQSKHCFEVNLANGGFKCWKACENCPVDGKGRAINLYRLYRPNLSYFEACDEIDKARYSPDTVVEVQKSKNIFSAPTVAEEEVRASADILDKTYRAFLSKLSLTTAHRNDLLNRGLTDKQIDEFGVKSIPTCGMTSIPAMLLQEGYTIQGVPLFAQKRDKWHVCTVKGKTGYFIPYYDLHGRMTQLQIRYDVKVTADMPESKIHDLKKSRYRWATSAGYKNGCSVENMAFWGRRKYFADKKVMFVTEGGLKATIASYISDEWFTAIPGITCYTQFEIMMEWCKKNGINTVVDAFDMDRNINPSVENAIKRLYEIAKSKDIDLVPWKWDDMYKGVDDFLFAQKQIGNKFEMPCVTKPRKTVIEDEIIPFSKQVIPLVPSFIKEDALSKENKTKQLTPVLGWVQK